MTDLRTAAQQALEALDGLSEDAVCQSSHHAKKDRHTSLDVCPVFLRLRAAITALKAALAEPVQESVAGVVLNEEGRAALVEYGQEEWHCVVRNARRLYTAQPQRKPLTDEEIDRVTDQQWAANNHKPIYAAHRAYARAIERAHGIGDSDGS